MSETRGAAEVKLAVSGEDATKEAAVIKGLFGVMRCLGSCLAAYGEEAVGRNDFS